MSTITAEHQLGAELRQRALSEIVPGIVCIPHVNFGRECFMFMPDWPQNDHLTTKASYLARMEMFGPEHPVVCPDHMQAGRPDLLYSRPVVATIYPTEGVRGAPFSAGAKTW